MFSAQEFEKLNEMYGEVRHILGGDADTFTQPIQQNADNNA